MKTSPRKAALAFTLLLGAVALAAPAQAQGAAGAPAAAAAQDGQSATVVLVAHPVLAALTETLAQGTGIRVERAAPANLPATRHASYFMGRGGKALQTAAGKAHAVVAMRSVWPDDPLYPMARRSNIRLVEIDAALPLDGALSGIALQPGERAGSQFAAYPWLGTANLGRMADIIAADLGRLAPQEQAAIDGNLARIKRQLVEINASSQAALARAENVSVISLSERLPYLVSSFNLDLVETMARDDADWTPERLQALTAAIRDSGAAAVLMHREADPALRQAIEAGGAKPVLLHTEGSDPLGELRQNAQALQQALAP
ncbi:zinc ABC transporter substrate-binding protein [Orrella sp. JC864]|uniref:metal ABC transporter solute-binding protein, Zn/Mn family n=1 Tax=Orrella sp. JC864 TaxID=3120298 RepID=UPI0012BCAD6E